MPWYIWLLITLIWLAGMPLIFVIAARRFHLRNQWPKGSTPYEKHREKDLIFITIMTLIWPIGLTIGSLIELAERSYERSTRNIERPIDKK